MNFMHVVSVFSWIPFVSEEKNSWLLVCRPADEDEGLPIPNDPRNL